MLCGVRGIEPGAIRTSDNLRQHVSTQLASVQSVLDQMLVDQPRRRILRGHTNGLASNLVGGGTVLVTGALAILTLQHLIGGH